MSRRLLDGKGRVLRTVNELGNKKSRLTKMEEGSLDFRNKKWRLPIPEQFVPSTDDEADAQRTKLPVSLSVWDWGRTTVEEAKSLTRPTSPEHLEQLVEQVVFRLKVCDVNTLRDQFKHERLRVVDDPISPPTPEVAGSGGHCGLEGLDRQDEGKKLFKDLRVALTRICREVEGEGGEGEEG